MQHTRKHSMHRSTFSQWMQFATGGGDQSRQLRRHASEQVAVIRILWPCEQSGERFQMYLLFQRVRATVGASPNWRSQRSTIQVGCDAAIAMASAT